MPSMRHLFNAAFLVLLLCGCNDTGRTPKLLPSNVRPDVTLAGSYYQGDGLGFNLHLDLAADGHFTCKWTGCLGEYGSTQGRWGRDGDKILIAEIRSTGMFKDSPLGNMQIVTYDGDPRLLRDEDQEFLKDSEMLLFVSFARTD